MLKDDKTTYRLNIRKFLNPTSPGGSAHIIARVEDTSKKTGLYTYSEMELSIADCSRTIRLEFDTDTAPSRASAVYKINVLIDTLLKFREALGKEIDIGIKREIRTKKEEAKEKKAQATLKLRRKVEKEKELLPKKKKATA